jgi:type IV secretory pathway TraG/TraD family ATPase VirD4
MENGEGVGVIDPHGDLIEETLANVPKERIDDVVLFEPFDTQRPCGLNMLEWKTAEQKDFAVSEMISIFSQLFPPEMIGPMFEHYMRNAMLALMADKENPGTLVEIPKMFTDEDFMKEKVEKVTDPMVRSFWIKEWQKTVGEDKSKMLGYVVSKVGRFVENEMMRNIIGQKHSSFDLSEIMDEGKIFLVNLTKGLTGEINSSLLGLILVSKLQMAAMKRVNIPLEQRKDFYLYIDEFQNFTTDSIATILSEARKYRLNLTLANQFMPQLKEEIRDAVIGNVGTLLSYRVGEDDAEFLRNKFSPEFSSFDLANINNYHYIAKMIVDGNLTSPFKVKAPYPQKGNKGQIKAIKKLSKQKYGRPKREVERKLKESNSF